MERVEVEAFGLLCPCLADEVVGSKPFAGLEPGSDITGVDDVAEMAAWLVVRVVVVARRCRQRRSEDRIRCGRLGWSA
jgi:hypothetical protein